MYFSEAKLLNKMIIRTKSHKQKMLTLFSIISLGLSLSLTLTIKKWDFATESHFIYSRFFMRALVP